MVSLQLQSHNSSTCKQGSKFQKIRWFRRIRNFSTNSPISSRRKWRNPTVSKTIWHLVRIKRKVVVIIICNQKDSLTTTTGKTTQKEASTEAISETMVGSMALTTLQEADISTRITNFLIRTFAIDASSQAITFEIALRMAMLTSTHARTEVFQSSTSGRCNWSWMMSSNEMREMLLNLFSSRTKSTL